MIGTDDKGGGEANGSWYPSRTITWTHWSGAFSFQISQAADRQPPTFLPGQGNGSYLEKFLSWLLVLAGGGRDGRPLSEAPLEEYAAPLPVGLSLPLEPLHRRLDPDVWYEARLLADALGTIGDADDDLDKTLAVVIWAVLAEAISAWTKRSFNTSGSNTCS